MHLRMRRGGRGAGRGDAGPPHASIRKGRDIDSSTCVKTKRRRHVKRTKIAARRRRRVRLFTYSYVSAARVHLSHAKTETIAILSAVRREKCTRPVHRGASARSGVDRVRFAVTLAHLRPMRPGRGAARRRERHCCGARKHCSLVHQHERRTLDCRPKPHVVGAEEAWFYRRAAVYVPIPIQINYDTQLTSLYHI